MISLKAAAPHRGATAVGTPARKRGGERAGGTGGVSFYYGAT